MLILLQIYHFFKYLYAYIFIIYSSKIETIFSYVLYKTRCGGDFERKNPLNVNSCMELIICSLATYDHYQQLWTIEHLISFQILI